MESVEAKQPVWSSEVASCLLWEAVSHLLASCLSRGSRRRVLYSLPGRGWEGGSCCLQLIEVQPTPGGHIVCLIQANIQGGRMNRVDIQIVPDDEGYREVGIIFWTSGEFLNKILFALRFPSKRWNGASCLRAMWSLRNYGKSSKKTE